MRSRWNFRISSKLGVSSRLSSRLAVVTCSLIGTTALLVGCSSSGSSTKAAGTDAPAGSESSAPAEAGGGSKKLIDGRNFATGNPAHVDPALSFTVDGAEFVNVLFDGLTGFDWSDPKDPKLVPAAAEKWTGNPDGTEFVFNIRKHNFSNGSPVLPSSFAYAWNRAADPKLAATYSYLFFNIAGGKERVEGKAETISGIVADDEKMTLTVKLSRPFADFPTMVTHNIFYPLDQPTVSKLADQAKYEQEIMIGNGPYLMATKLVPDKGVTVTKSPTYWGTPGALDEINFTISKDLDSAYAAFEAGQFDIAAIPSGKFKSATEKHPFVQAPAQTIDYYVFNFDDPAVGGPKNEKLRQAISMALDRKAITDAVCEGSCIVADSMLPPGITGQTNICTICAHDVAKAKALLEEWKKEGNTLAPIELAFNSGAGHEDTINLMQAELQEAGIEVKQMPMSSDTYFQTMAKTPAQFFRLGWAADYPLYDNFTYDLLASDSANNYGKFKSPEFDALIAKARATTDPGARAKAYQEAEALAVNPGYALPMFWGNGGFVFSDKVKGATRFPNSFANYRSMTVG
jgi:oligopeptide transport system substrate-binding protein